MTATARPIAPRERLAYDAVARETGTLFDLPEWGDLYGEKLERCGIISEAGDLVGGFQYVRARRMGLSVVRNPSFTPWCGPFLRIRSLRPVAILEERRAALAAMARYLATLKAGLVWLALSPGIQDGLPFLWNKLKVSPVFTYRLNLERSEDEIWTGYAGRIRNDIKKARKDGLVVAVGQDYGGIEAIQLGSLARQGKRVDRAAMQKILGLLSRTGAGFTVTVSRASVPLAAALVAYHRSDAYYLMGGYVGNGEQHHGAGALALHTAILNCQSMGLTSFDFEGSSLPAVERFFRGFGGELAHNLQVVRALLPVEMAMKVARRQYF